MRVLAVMLLALLLPACASRGTEASFELAPASYAEAFDATREALLDCRFTLERVDAHAGVITTAPKATAGLLSPWDGEHSSLRDELEDFTSHQRRVVRVEFQTGPPTAVAPATPGQSVELLGSPADADTPLTATVRVVIERRYVPGRTIEAESIRRSTTFVDLDLVSRGMQPVYYVPIGDDPQLAARLVEMIRARLAAG